MQFEIPAGSTIKDSRNLVYSLTADGSCKLKSVQLYVMQSGERRAVHDTLFENMLLQYELVVKVKNLLVNCAQIQADPTLKSALERILRMGFLEP